jgi:hypothetical protein
MLSPVTPMGERIARVTSQYGESRGDRIHLGQDWLFPRLAIDPPYSSTNPRGSKGSYIPARATARAVEDGYVEYANSQASGMVIRLRHQNFQSLYLHLRDVYVSSGQYVTVGQALGELGGDPRTGRGSPYGTDPFYPSSRYGVVHLHYETRDFNNQPFDPRLAKGNDGNTGFNNDGLDLVAMASEYAPTVGVALTLGLALVG